MDIVNEIRDHFSSTINGKAIPISAIQDAYPAWVVRLDDRYGVAVEVSSDIQISERFSNVRYFTKELILGEQKKNLLLLTSSLEQLRQEFSNICALFVQPGAKGEDRANIVNNPHEWWLKWKELLGNSNYDKTVYSILGEMIIYLYLLKIEANPKWTGPKSGTVDFESSASNFEVKSTLNKYDAIVTVNSQYQLKTNKDLSLIFCRFEESNYGISIDTVFDQLINAGVDPLELNKTLFNIGIEENSLDRKKKYKVLELRKYNIDSYFPRITENSFKNSKMPNNIIHLTYKVDLSGIDYDLIPTNFINC